MKQSTIDKIKESIKDLEAIGGLIKVKDDLGAIEEH